MTIFLILLLMVRFCQLAQKDPQISGLRYGFGLAAAALKPPASAGFLAVILILKPPADLRIHKDGILALAML